MLEMLKMAEEGATNQTKHTYAAAPRVAFNDIWKKKQKTKNKKTGWSKLNGTLALPGSLWKGHRENLLSTKKTNYRKSDTENVKSRGKGPLGRDKMEQEKQFGHWKTDYSEWSLKYVFYTSQ